MGKKRKDSGHIWHNRLDGLLLFFSVGTKKKQQKKLKKGGLDTGNQDVGFLVTPLSSKVRLLPQKEAGGHIKLKSPGEKIHLNGYQVCGVDT